MSGLPVMRGAWAASAAATISAIIRPPVGPNGITATARCQGGGLDETRLLRDAAAPARGRPGHDHGRRPRPAGDPGPPRLRRGVDRRALHGAVGEHPVPRPLHRACARHDEEDEPGPRRVVPPQPRPPDARPAPPPPPPARPPALLPRPR